jgi:hypothetical protein
MKQVAALTTTSRVAGVLPEKETTRQRDNVSSISPFDNDRRYLVGRLHKMPDERWLNEHGFNRDPLTTLIERSEEQNRRLEEQNRRFEDLKRHMDRTFVPKVEFWPVKIIVYGMIGIIATAVLTGLMAFILKRP